MLIKVCPKSGERQSKNDFLLIFFYIQSKGAAQSSILMILRHPLFVPFLPHSHRNYFNTVCKYLEFKPKLRCAILFLEQKQALKGR